MKKRISFCLILCMLLSLIAATGITVSAVEEASGTCGEAVNWAISSNGVLTISGEGPMDDYFEDHDIPWYQREKDIVKVIVEDGVSHVGGMTCYGFSSATSIYLGKDVASFGENAFYGCISLPAFEINPENASYCTIDGILYTKDGKTVVSCPSGKSGIVEVASSAEVIGEYAFQLCASIPEIILGENVTTIKKGAFYACVELETIYFGKNVTTLSDEIFAYCTKLEAIEISEQNTTYKSIDGIIYSADGKTLVSCPCGKSGNIIIPETTEKIGNSAFAMCTLIESVVIPDNVVSMGDNAFSHCENLTSVEIGAGITNISQYAFAYCYVLENVKVGKNVEVVGAFAFFNCEGLKGIVLPDTVVEIGQSAFQRCYKLRSIDVGNSLKKIGKLAFCQCNQLPEITLPGTVTTINYNALGFIVTGIYDYQKVEGFTIKGVAGTKAESYANSKGFTFVEYVEDVVPEPAPGITELPEHDFYMNTESATMPNVNANTKVSTLVLGLAEFGVTVTVTDKDGNVLVDDSNVGTGCIVTNTADGTKFTVVVLGDVDGNGEIISTDYLRIKGFFLGNITLENEYFVSADVDKNNEITSTDYLRIKAFFLGNYDIYA